MVNECKISPIDFQSRLEKVTENEILSGICDENGKGIVVQVSARDWKFSRLVMYHQISDDDVDLMIKKIVYCIQEFDKN